MEISQTVLTGLILAFIFRAFMVEPFIIPTGSMAGALLGAHATRICPACGQEYDFSSLRPTTPTGAGFVCPAEIICPNCQLRLTPTPDDTAPKAGDRILVHKWPYVSAIAKPQRWEVIVFRDPANPLQHYIKRIVGLPRESVEIVDGDVFINGRIQRKPPHVQRVMWLIVYNQSHVPSPHATSGRLPRWTSLELPEDEPPAWTGFDTRVLHYDRLDTATRRIAFNPDTGREYLNDLSAYNRRSSGAAVGDVRLVADLTMRAGDGWCGLEIARPPYRFQARLHRAGRAELWMVTPEAPDAPQLIDAVRVPALMHDRPIAVELGHLDWRVYLKINRQRVLRTSDRQYTPDLEQLRRAPGARPVGLHLLAKNIQLTIQRLRIDRDVHYTESRYSKRAQAGNPFPLGNGEYFVLGDNSPDSHDSREWNERGVHLPENYRLGTVTSDQIVGRAAFVYLPGLLPRDLEGRWRVPDLGRVRFVR
jgi:signal peptidase I